MNRVPSGWKWASIDEIAGGVRSHVAIGPFGSNLKVSDYQESGVPLIFVRNIRSRDFGPASLRYVSFDKARELSAHEVLPGDLLITKMGDPPGDAAVYPSIPPAVMTADCIRLRPGPAADAQFLRYAFEAPIVRQQFQQITRGVAQQKVSLARFRQAVVIPLPPVAEQRRIVDLLDDFLSRLGASEAAVGTASMRLASLEQSALSTAYRQGELHDLGSIASIQGGIQKQPKRAPANNAYAFLRVANVTKHGLDLAEVHRVELFGNELERLRLKPGDLLVVEGNGSASQIGRAAVWNGAIQDCVHQNHLIRVRPEPGLHPNFLEAVWNSPQHRAVLSEVASSTSGLHTLSVAKLKQLRIPLPAWDSQVATVEAVTALRTSRKRLDDQLAQASQRAAALRRSLLAAAFSGQL